MKLKTKPFNSKKFIRAAANAIAPVIDQISTMTPEQQRAVVAACNALTQTNCWWLEFWVAPILKREAEGELLRAARLAKQPA